MANISKVELNGTTYNINTSGSIPESEKGAANGVASLDSSGKVPSSQLPSYVDDVLEYSAKSSFPASGETGKIYVDTSTNKTYRWSGSAYVEISESLALGETSSTAYRGDRGKAAYEHSQTTSGNPHNVTAAEVGAVPKTSAGVSAAINLLTTSDSDPTDNDYYVSQYAGGGTSTTTYHRRPVSKIWNYIKNKLTSTTTSAGLTDTEKSNARANIGAGTGNGTYSKPSSGIPKTDLASSVRTSLGKADTALQSFTETDPTVPSWAKQTNKPTYNSDEISDTNRTHKFATQSQLNQIGVNQTNILYGINNGVKNICDYVNPLQLNNCEIVDGEFKQTVADSKANLNFMASAVRSNGTTYAMFTAAIITTNGEYSYEFDFPADAVAIRIGHNGTTRDAKFDINIDHFVVGTTYVISINVLNCVQASGMYRFNKIMICTKQLWDTIGHDFQPPALPNSDLTRLEAEDRAALAEEIDAGAKNLLDVLNRASVTTGGITCTFNSDGTITLNGTATGSPATYIYLYTTASGNNPWKAPNAGTYVMSCEGAVTSDFCMYDNGNWGTTPTLNSERTLTKGQAVPIILRVVNGKVLSNVTIKPMICTKAAFGVSKAFVPYRVPIIGKYAVLKKIISCSTTETSTGIKFTSTKTANYRVTATAMHSSSRPLTLKVKQKTNSSDTLHNFLNDEQAENMTGSLSVCGMIQLGVGGELEVFAKYETAADNQFYMLVEELG